MSSPPFGLGTEVHYYSPNAPRRPLIPRRGMVVRKHRIQAVWWVLLEGNLHPRPIHQFNFDLYDPTIQSAPPHPNGRGCTI